MAACVLLSVNPSATALSHILELYYRQKYSQLPNLYSMTVYRGQDWLLFLLRNVNTTAPFPDTLGVLQENNSSGGLELTLERTSRIREAVRVQDY